MNEKQTIDLNLIELVNLAAKILSSVFINAPKDKAKPVFKGIKQGKTLPLGTIKIQDKLEPKLQLALDYSEFRGPGFNYDVFEASLKAVLAQISRKFQEKGDLNILNSENGSLVIHLPGVVQLNDQFNVLVMALELGNMETITIKLMYVDPDQYDELNKKPA
jgi:hypothetical protein